MVIEIDNKIQKNTPSNILEQSTAETGLEQGSFASNLRKHINYSELQGLEQPDISSNVTSTDERLVTALSTGKGLEATKDYLSASPDIVKLMSLWESSPEFTNLPEDMKKLWKEG